MAYLSGVLLGLIASAAFAAWFAERKGRDFWVVFFFCLVTGTGLLVGIYMALFARPHHSADDEPRDRLSELERLARLHADGALTDHEFADEKARVLEAQG